MPQTIQPQSPLTIDSQVNQKNKEQAQTKNLPPYTVILHNDPLNTIEYVVQTLRKVFGFGLTKAIYLTLKVHFQGKGALWSGHKEYAEMKAEQIRNCGADPSMIHRGAKPLQVTIEPLK